MFRLLGSSTAQRLGYIRPIGVQRQAPPRQRNTLLSFPSSPPLRFGVGKSERGSPLHNVLLSSFPVFGREHKQMFVDSACVQLSEECSLF